MGGAGVQFAFTSFHHQQCSIVAQDYDLAMRIIILGAGQVGASVAEALASEANDITIVDQSREALGDIADRLDVRTLVGNGALPSVLRNAGMEDADMLVAVTQSDATNLVACKIARSVFNVTTRVARLRSADYLDDKTLLDDEHFAVTHAICPEQEITDYIARLIEFPEALQVLEFADGRVTLVCVRAYEGGLLVGKPIKAMREHLPPRGRCPHRRDLPRAPAGRSRGQHHHRGRRRGLRAGRHRAHPAGDARAAAHAEAGQAHHDRRRRQHRRRAWPLALEADHEVKVVERDPARAEMVAATRCSAAWCCTAKPPTRTCWRRRTSTRWTCSSP
jgi:Trk K+ transport system NAD-binding subunit